MIFTLEWYSRSCVGLVGTVPHAPRMTVTQWCIHSSYNKLLSLMPIKWYLYIFWSSVTECMVKKRIANLTKWIENMMGLYECLQWLGDMVSWITYTALHPILYKMTWHPNFTTNWILGFYLWGRSIMVGGGILDDRSRDGWFHWRWTTQEAWRDGVETAT